MNQADFIPGIYNYCDTWCERCPFTARCHSFQMQQDEPVASTGGAVNSGEVLVKQLTEALNLTKQYIEKLQAQGNIPNLNEPSEAEKRALEEEAAFRRQQVKNHPIAQLSHQYLRTSGEWLRSEVNLLEIAGNQQLRVVEMGIRDYDEAVATLNVLKDAWEMIKWYRTLIPVKAMSALRVLSDPTTDPHLNDYYLGKAKLVLVCIDRSLSAWQTMLDSYPEKIDEALDALALLSRMRREMEELFPNARAFRRPGLD
jgi:prefoldin subunit 5